MKEFIDIFEYILTELNDGVYYNPLQHTPKENEMFAGKFGRNSAALQPKENGKAIFHGVEIFKDSQVLSFYCDSFKFKQPISLFITGFSKLLKALEIKPSEIKKESEYSEDELKTISKLKKITNKNTLRKYTECVFFLPELNKSFASDGTIFALLGTRINRRESCAYNVFDKNTVNELPLKVDSIKNAMSFNSNFKITFDSVSLRFALKSAISKYESFLCLSQTHNIYYDVNLLSKLISFVPKKQSIITLMIAESNNCAHIVTESGDHFGLMPAYPKDTADINNIVGMEECCEYSVNYIDIANDIANEKDKFAETVKELESPESVESINQDEERIETPEKFEKFGTIELNISKTVENGPSEPGKSNNIISYIETSVNNIAYLLIILRYFELKDIDVGVHLAIKNKVLKNDIRIRNKSSPLL